jgi:hypothetical protein
MDLAQRDKMLTENLMPPGVRAARSVNLSEAASCMFDVPLLLSTLSEGHLPSSDTSPSTEVGHTQTRPCH